MARRQASENKPGSKKRTTPPTERLKGQTFFFAGRWIDDKQEAAAVLAVAGGKIAEKLTKDVNYVVIERKATGTTPAEKQVARLNAKEILNIQVITCRAAIKLAMPTADDLMVLLASGKAIEAWEGIHRHLLRDRRPGLANANLQNAKLPRASFYFVKVDGADFSGADLSASYWLRGDNIRLDGALLRNAGRINLGSSSAMGLDAVDAYFERIAECKLDGANLEHASISHLKHASFRKANCRKLWVSGYSKKPISSDFSNADLSQADLEGVNLSGSTFHGAKLAEARLNRCRFNQTDLSNADMRNARLIGANLTGAKVDGANFAGANLMDAQFKGVDFSKAKGFDPTATRLTSGPALRQFQDIARKATDLRIKAEILLAKGCVKLTVAKRADGVHFYQWSEQVAGSDAKLKHNYLWDTRSFAQTLLEAADLWRAGTLRIDSIRVTATKPPVEARELKNAAIAACCEAFGIGLADEQVKSEAKRGKPSPSQLRTELLEELLGKGGVKKFNAHTQAEIAKAGSFRKTDFGGERLNAVRFPILDLESADFAGASLSKAKFEQCKCDRASFKKANLKTASLTTSRFNGADFADADLSRATLAGCSLRKAVFHNARLADANLTSADLTGVDLSSADLKDARFTGARFDETTRFPSGFQLPQDMDWRGKGANPALRVRRKKVGSLSMEEFMAHLGKSVDAQRLKNALKMLKADRFQLFVEINDDSLVGVVKSQRDKELVYSCQLTGEGDFACCTQNLNICGGLRGALCKHLLVLIVGLVRSGRIDAAEIDNWIAASKAHRPQLDKDVMSETLLRYKRAEAGEIDWRPTETVPEDFYAF